MEEYNVPYIEIRFSYSQSFIYQECLGLAKKMSGFVPAEKNSSGWNVLIYTKDQVKEYDIYFELFLDRVFRLRRTSVYYKGIEVDRNLLDNIKWHHRQKKSQPYGKPIGLYEEFFIKEYSKEQLT